MNVNYICVHVTNTYIVNTKSNARNNLWVTCTNWWCGACMHRVQKQCDLWLACMTCSCAIVACLGKKLLVGCTSYLGIEDVYMEVVGKEMTCISIPMSRGKEMSFGSHHRNFSIESRDDMYLNSYEEGLEKRCHLVHIIGTFLLNIR